MYYRAGLQDEEARVLHTHSIFANPVNNEQTTLAKNMER